MLAPGPKPFPIVGSLPAIGLGKALGIGPQPHQRMTELARTYGDVMTVYMGREPWVILSSPRAVHEAFVGKGSDFSGRPMVPSMSVSSGGGQGFARSSVTPALKRLRREAVGDLFSAHRVERARAEFEKEAEMLAHHLVKSSNGTADSSLLRKALRKVATNMVLRYVFSSRAPYSTEDASRDKSEHGKCVSRLVDLINEIWAELTSISTTTSDLLLRNVDTTGPMMILNSKLRDLVEQRDNILRELIAIRRRTTMENVHSEAPGDMLDTLLASSLPEMDVLYTLVDMFVAGVNTTAATMEWMLLLLANDPLAQERARARVSLPQPHRSGRASGDYIDALVKEVLRAKPPLLLPRQAVRDTSVRGYSIPAGTVVLANNHALTQDERWWDRPRLFRPERFVEEAADLGSGSAA